MVLIRPGTADDIQAVLRLWSAEGVEPSHTDDASSLVRLLGFDAGALLVAELDGHVVGTVIAAWDGWRGSIYRLVVKPDLRRQGLGRQLLDAAEAHLAEVGAVRSQAIVAETSAPAMAYWRSTGWIQQRARARFVRG